MCDSQRHRHRKPRARTHATHHRRSLQEKRVKSSYNEAVEQPAIGGSNAYIRQWLEHTVEGDSTSLRSSGEEKSKAVMEDNQDIRHKLLGRSQLKGIPFLDVPTKPTRARHRHHSSSDSSLLKPMERSRSPILFAPDKTTRPTHRPEPSKRRKAKSSTCGGSESVPRVKGRFEKRARHKTRQDLYEPKKANQAKDIKEKEPKKKREKRGDRKKAAKKAGQDLLDKFSSRSIGQDRLTMRPNHGPGLFNNGRASSPVKRRGYLAFSEMAFLQRGSSSKIEAPESKCRAKEQRRDERAHAEISSFFKPIREASIVKDQDSQPEISSTRGRIPTTGVLASDQHSRLSKRDRSNGDQGMSRAREFAIQAQSRSVKQSIDHVGFVSEAVLNTTVNAISGTSCSSDSYMTWSESQFSSQPTARPDTTCHRNREQRSPTPEEIRRSITNTGVFEGTGIDRQDTPKHTCRKTLHTTSERRFETTQSSHSRESNDPSSFNDLLAHNQPSPYRCHSGQSHDNANVVSQDVGLEGLRWQSQQTPRNAPGDGQDTSHYEEEDQDSRILHGQISGTEKIPAALNNTLSRPATREELARKARIPLSSAIPLKLGPANQSSRVLENQVQQSGLRQSGEYVPMHGDVSVAPRGPPNLPILEAPQTTENNEQDTFSRPAAPQLHVIQGVSAVQTNPAPLLEPVFPANTSAPIQLQASGQRRPSRTLTTVEILPDEDIGFGSGNITQTQLHDSPVRDSWIKVNRQPSITPALPLMVEIGSLYSNQLQHESDRHLEQHNELRMSHAERYIDEGDEYNHEGQPELIDWNEIEERYSESPMIHLGPEFEDAEEGFDSNNGGSGNTYIQEFNVQPMEDVESVGFRDIIGGVQHQDFREESPVYHVQELDGILQQNYQNTAFEVDSPMPEFWRPRRLY